MVVMSTQQSPANLQSGVNREKIYQWIVELSNPETRENALLELSKKRVVPDLAPMLWHSFGTIAVLLQEIVNIYPAIKPSSLTAHQSNHVCNTLALLLCVASHPETRSAFLQANIHLYLYPFLHTGNKTRPFEYLKVTSLLVIGALVKTAEQEVFTFLLTTEIIPTCVFIMERGTQLSKTVATFILQKILLDDRGLSYICQTDTRFSHFVMVLGKMVLSLAKDPSARLLKLVVRCYLRLSDNPRARHDLHQCLPDQLRDATFANCLQDDKSTKHLLSQLLKNLETGSAVGHCLMLSGTVFLGRRDLRSFFTLTSQFIPGYISANLKEGESDTRYLFPTCTETGDVPPEPTEDFLPHLLINLEGPPDLGKQGDSDEDMV